MRKSSNPKNDKNFDLELILKLEKEGKNIKEISKILDIDKHVVRYRLKKLGIFLRTTRSRLNKKHDYFDTIDTELKAYFLGFIVADGCIQEERTKSGGVTKNLVLNNSIDDFEILNKFQKEIFGNENLQFRNSTPNRKRQCRVKINSTYLVDNLINNFNIKPNKTLDFDFLFPFEKIPTKYVRHFIRGFFDGDGCISMYTKSNIKRMSFVFTSKPFMGQISTIIKESLPEISISYDEKVGKTINHFVINISLGKNKLEIVRDYLYKDSTIFLQRKFLKFNSQNTVLI